jgi:ECF transporter S component (folate family)
VGGLSDLIASLMQGGTLPLITLGAAMLGFIPGLVSKIPKLKPQFKIAISYVLIYIITTLVINSLALYPILGGGKTFWAFLIYRLPKQTIVLVINIFLTYLIYFPLAKLFYRKTTQQTKTFATTENTQKNAENTDIKPIPRH